MIGARKRHSLPLSVIADFMNPYRFSRFQSLLCLGGCIFLSASDNARGQTPSQESDFSRYAIYEKTAPRPPVAEPQTTQLPLEIEPNARIAFLGNTLLERTQQFGHFETMLHQHLPNHRLIVRNLAWSADAVDLQPRPENFADLEQHLYHEKIDLIFAAFGFNESFAGKEGLSQFRESMSTFVDRLKTHAYNGRKAPKIILLSPIANENVRRIPAADRNNQQIEFYVQAIRDLSIEKRVGFANVYSPTLSAMSRSDTDLTINGCHLNEQGDLLFAQSLFREVFKTSPPMISEPLRQAVIDRDRQFARRYRPLNTFYYTGGRNKEYGYLDFLPAMRSFEQMVANRDERIWAIAQGKPVPAKVDDSNVAPMPPAQESRGINEWMSPEDERKAFQIDPRFEVNIFASEEDFPEIANPIQMRFDSRGRLWVSTSITYPHIYPGNEPQDRLLILEDTDQDGRADKCTTFANNLHVPLSFELGDGGVYVSEQPELTFLEDLNGDDRMDRKRTLLSGFGTEDSHHALHDFTWTPDGDLILRESIFHHSQIETPYGPVRQQNSGWFRYTPREERLISFGSYPSTNPWGVTFDDWGRHVASHPIFAAAFHSLDPPYPQQHPAPNGLKAYSGTCGHQFVNTPAFPKELQGCFIKARYKPTNRIEIHQWVRQPFGYEERYMGDLIFSTNLSFIPVDVQFGPRGDLYICDWYNPVKGHAQYSLRDSRRDRSSGRIWRVVAKNHALQSPPKIAGASIPECLDLLKRPESELRFRVKRELRAAPPEKVKQELDLWVSRLDQKDSRFRHHQLEALWVSRMIGQPNTALLKELAGCEDPNARAAAVQQLRYANPTLEDTYELLKRAIHDEDALVRMEAVIAASYLGSERALPIALEIFEHPIGDHLSYAIQCALGSHTLRRLWEGNDPSGVEKKLKQLKRTNDIVEPRATAQQSQFDNQPNLQTVKISCEPERMLFTLKEFTAAPGQPVKIIFTNPDATDHNLVIVQPGTLEEVGTAANDMAKDPKNADSDFIPPSKQALILHATPMIGPNRKSRIHILRFEAPKEPGVYPFVCTYPGHWIIMNGRMLIGGSDAEIEELRKSQTAKSVKEWTLTDFPEVGDRLLDKAPTEATLTRGMQAFTKAQCLACHRVSGHGVNLGPDLSESIKKHQGKNLLRQILEPSHEIHPQYQATQFLLENGNVLSGSVVAEDDTQVQIIPSLLTPDRRVQISKREIEERRRSNISSMPSGLVNVLTKEEILDLLRFLESGAKHEMHHD
jgi:putative heme-binding domain-containing protein